MEDTFISLKHITKYYPGVVALSDANLELKRGEVHALMGENGAGKSTLIKAMTGAIPFDKGSVVIGDNEYTHMTPTIAANNGIQVIFQELNLINQMTAMDNIYVGIPPKKAGGMIDKKAMEEGTRKIFDKLGVKIDPYSIVGLLPTAQQQMVEIAKSLIRVTKLLVLDEPTSVLSNTEVEILFRVVNKLKAEGVTIVYISHRIEEVFRITDRITIMRDGEIIKTVNTKEIDRPTLIKYMVGRDFREVYPENNCEKGEVALEVDHISGEGYEDISFRLRAGEILGLGGLVGAGRTETARGIVAATKLKSGTIKVKGKKVHFRGPADAVKSGIALLPEDRKLQGLVLQMSVLMNADVSALQKVSTFGVLNKSADEKMVQEYVEKLSVKTPNLNTSVRTLSGGNQQKVILARWLCSDCDVLIFDEPTRGIDVNAKKEIYDILCELTKQGKAILMISSDMEELLGMSDRIIVMSEGRQAGELAKEDFSQELVLEYASGVR